MQYQREFVAKLLSRLSEPASLPQVLLGPRQVGKTTGVQQLLAQWKGPKHFATADGVAEPDREWIELQWQQAKAQVGSGRALLVLDEVQRVPDWTVAIKSLWDQERRHAGQPLALCLLGSSAMMLARGLSESLAGRFELLKVGHWQYAEMRDAFGFSLEQFIFFGGYPGAVGFIDDPPRWAAYVNETLVEAALNRDLLALHPVDKPVLLRRMFQLACAHPAEILAYNKMLGQLTEAGNVSTLAKYQQYLGQAGLLVGLPKYSGSQVRQRASSPKWLPLNTALITAARGMTLAQWKAQPDAWGRLVEAAVGAHLWAEAEKGWGAQLSWWRDGNYEMDFVLSGPGGIMGFEVKSGRGGLRSHKSLSAFATAYPKAGFKVVGTDGLPLQAVFDMGLEALMARA